jgi:hypothetical protein
MTSQWTAHVAIYRFQHYFCYWKKIIDIQNRLIGTPEIDKKYSSTKDRKEQPRQPYETLKMVPRFRKISGISLIKPKEFQNCRIVSFDSVMYLFMLIVWNYASYLWPLTTLVFIPRLHKNMKSHSGMILTENTEGPGEKYVPVPLCPTQIPHGLNRVQVTYPAWTYA